MALSFEDLRRKLDEAVQQKFGQGATTDSWKYYVMETFDDYVIARGTDDKTFQIPYSVDVNGEIQLGDPQEVEEIYVPVQEAALFQMPTPALPAGDSYDDFTYPVVALKAGFAKGKIETSDGKSLRQYFPIEVVAEVAAALNGTRFGRRHPAGDENEAAQPELVAGWFSDARMVGDEAQATLHLLQSETDLAAKLAAARKAGKLDLFGISVLGYFAFKIAQRDGEQVMEATKLGKLARVDLVAEAAAGGRFLGSRLAASADLRAEISRLQHGAIKVSAHAEKDGSTAKGAGRQKGATMKEQILKLLAALRKQDPAGATKLEAELQSVAEDKQTEFFDKVTEALAATKPAATAIDANDEANKTLLEARKIQTSNLVETKLAAAKLPAPAATLVRDHLKDQVADEARVDAEIEKVRTAFAAMSQTGRVGSPLLVRPGLDSMDKVRLAMDGMLGVKASADKGVKPFRGLKDAYIFVTGDHDLDFGRGGRGGFTRTTEAVATTDFANLLLDSMTKRALQDYAEVGMGGLELVFTKSSVGDYKTQNRVRAGYFADLATLGQNAAYPEFAYPTDEKISYAVGKYGNLLTISEETIRNDDLNQVTAFPKKIVRAGRRTLKQFITNFFINNGNFDGDSVAVFHASHSNLGATALSVDELIAREVVLMGQTEKDSNKPLGLKLNWLMVPNTLGAVAWKINNSEFYNPGPGIKEPNPYYKRFGQNNERIIVNELLTDTNDWYYGADPSEAPCVEIGFLDGIEEPQIFLDNNGNTSVGFTNDQIRFKVKSVFGGDWIDFRGVGKAVVA